MAVPEALEVAESVPQGPGLQFERVQDTPLFWGSFATVAVKICVCDNWTVTDAGETATEMAGWGGGAPGAGGSPVEEEEEWALGLGTDAQPTASQAATRLRTTTATGARGTDRAPESGFNVQILRYVCRAKLSLRNHVNCRGAYWKGNMELY
jgi:hypothetical protein